MTATFPSQLPCDILDRTFRANPAYELLELGELQEAERTMLSEVLELTSCFGVLKPKPNASVGTLKAVCRETAALWRVLERPAPLPVWVRHQPADSAAAAILQLVLDGVLEVGDGRNFVTGAAASSLLGSEAAVAPEPGGSLARISREALRYGQRLQVSDPLALAARLYHFGRIPLSPRWTRRFPSRDGIRAELKTGNGWRPGQEREGWLVWRAKCPAAASTDPAPGYKLYVSPRPEHVIEAGRALARIAVEDRAHHFKVGCDAAGVLRSDKIVAYFHEWRALGETARDLAQELDGCPAHGVPFTADLAGDGLLSWGVDPPSTGEAAGWHRGESWRLCVAKRLAAAILDARRTPGLDREPWEFALQRIRLDGIDPVNWTPTLAAAGDFSAPA